MTPDYSHWAYWCRHPFLWIEPLKWVVAFPAAWGGLYFRRWLKNRREETAQG